MKGCQRTNYPHYIHHVMSTWIQPGAPATVNLKIFRDADYTIPLTFMEGTGGPAIDVTGYTFECEFVAEQDDDVTPLLTVTVTLDDPENGSVSFALTREQTANDTVMPRDHYWRLWWTDTGDNRSLKVAGRVRMEER